MPNFLYMSVSLAYHLALALWIGGGVALGALAAPVIFGRLPRPEAGGIFGTILRRFARVRLAAIVVAIAAAATKHLLWERHGANLWEALRWGSLALMAAIVAYEILALEPAMGAHRARMTAEPEDGPERQRFMALHKRSEALMKVSLAAAVLAVFTG